MKKLFISSLLLSFGLSLPCGLFADEATAILTWKDVAKEAHEKNLDLLVSEQQAEASLARYHGSYNGVFPHLNLTNSYTDSKDNGSSAHRWGAAASASWDLFDLGEIAGVSIAHAAYNEAKASLRLVSSNVRLSLYQAFANLIFQENAANVDAMILSIRSTNARMIQLRYDSGVESKGNRMTTEAELLQAQVAVQQVKRDTRAAQQELNHQLGKDHYEAILATGSLSVEISTEDPRFDVLMDNHPAIAQKKAALDLARAGITQAYGTVFPNLSANYTRSFSGHTYFPKNPTWIASAVLSLPIFAQGPTASFYSIHSSLDDRNAAEAELASTRAQIRSTLESSWASLLDNLDQVKVQQGFLAAARQRNEEANVRYGSGLLSYDNWEVIVTARVNFEKSMIQAQLSAALAEASWRQAQGLGWEDDL